MFVLLSHLLFLQSSLPSHFFSSPLSTSGLCFVPVSSSSLRLFVLLLLLYFPPPLARHIFGLRRITRFSLLWLSKLSGGFFLRSAVPSRRVPIVLFSNRSTVHSIGHERHNARLWLQVIHSIGSCRKVPSGYFTAFPPYPVPPLIVHCFPFFDYLELLPSVILHAEACCGHDF